MVEKKTKWSYLEPLLFREDFIHLSEISREISKNHSVVRQYLNYFENDGIVIKKKVGRMSMYKLNLKYPLIIDVISLIEKEKLIVKSSDLYLREFISFVQQFSSLKMILFGSFTENSKKAKDIDFLVVGKIGKNDFSEIERKLNRKVHLINVLNLNEIELTLKREIMKKHLILRGVEDVVKWLV